MHTEQSCALSTPVIISALQQDDVTQLREQLRGAPYVLPVSCVDSAVSSLAFNVLRLCRAQQADCGFVFEQFHPRSQLRQHGLELSAPERLSALLSMASSSQRRSAYRALGLLVMESPEHVTHHIPAALSVAEVMTCRPERGFWPDVSLRSVLLSGTLRHCAK